MAPQSPPIDRVHISECSVGEVRLLVKTMQYQLENPDVLSQFRSTIIGGIKELPSRLQRPSALMSILKPHIKPKAPMCDLHRGIHPKIVHSLFTLIALEVGVQLNKLAANEHLLTEPQIQLVWRLRDLHSLWLDANTYEENFGRPASGEWAYEANQCEGCIITRIASRFEAVYDLRCALISRMSRRQIKRKGEPMLKLWVDHFMLEFREWTPSHIYGPAVIRNEVEGLDLKDAKKKIYYETRRAKKRAERRSRMADTAEDSDSSTAVESPERLRPISGLQERIEDGDDLGEDATGGQHDAELDIVDHYAALKSTLSLPVQTDSLPKGKSPYGQNKPADVYQSQSSVYTNNTFRNNDRVIGQSRASRVPSKVSEIFEPQDEYVNPRANWNRQSSAKQAGSDENIVSLAPTTARTVPQTARSGNSIWDDAPLSGVSSPGVRSVARGIVEQMLDSGENHQSKRASEWTAMPDLDSHTRDLNDNGVNSSGYRTSTVPKTPIDFYSDVKRPESTPPRHSQPESIAKKRGRAPSQLDAQIAKAFEKPANTAFRTSRTSFASDTSNSTGSWADSARSRAESVSSRYSTSAASSVSSMKPMPERRTSNLMPDFGRFKDRPSTGTPVPGTAKSNWSAIAKAFAPKDEKAEKGKGNGKRAESPRGRSSRR